jgi:hypothetical protein
MHFTLSTPVMRLTSRSDSTDCAGLADGSAGDEPRTDPLGPGPFPGPWLGGVALREVYCWAGCCRTMYA